MYQHEWGKQVRRLSSKYMKNFFRHMERSRQNDVVFLVFAKPLKGLQMLLFNAKLRQRFIEFHVIKVKLTIQRLTQWKCQVGHEAHGEPIILIRK